MGCCKKNAHCGRSSRLAEGAAAAAAHAGQRRCHGHRGHAHKAHAHGHHRHHKCGKLIAVAAVGLAAAAIWEELRKPAEHRTWHGFVGGVVPYDFRVPTPDRVIHNLWNPEGPVVSPKTFGVGWDPNFGRIVSEVIALPDHLAHDQHHGHHHEHGDADAAEKW